MSFYLDFIGLQTGLLGKKAVGRGGARWGAAVLFFLGGALMSGRAAQPAVERFTDYAMDRLFSVENGTVEKTADANGAPLIRWHPAAGKTSILQLRSDHPLFDRLRYYDRLDFQFRILGGEVNEIGLWALGHVSGPRQYKVHQYELAIRTTPRNVWLRRQVDLNRPNWFPWDKVDGTDGETFFRFQVLALVPGVVVEFRDPRLTRARLMLKPDYEFPITWFEKRPGPNGSVIYSADYQVLNATGAPAEITAEVGTKLKRFRAGFVPIPEKGTEEKQGAAMPAPVSPFRLSVKHARIATFRLQAEISAADIAAVPELYHEPLMLRFTASTAPDAPCVWQGDLVRPLSPKLRRQVVIAPDDLARIRQGLKDDPKTFKRLVGLPRILRSADALLQKKLLHIPWGHDRCANNWRGAWRPGDAMPEAINLKTGEREFGTPTASYTWKTYFAYPGMALENLGKAYLYSGEEKYAQKAVALFRLYAQQYKELYWDDLFQVPWNRGPATLGSSRTSTSSTYGSNMFFKWHCRLLSMTADSPAWTTAVRREVYRGFVLPYATELMKFPGGISNMTDISNHNVLLLGLVFDDAHLVYWATHSDPGVLSRLRDLDADGFSAEGRPLNYHFAGMTEYLPSLVYLKNSGISAAYPAARLLAAFRMPYYRAALNGIVPATGDCGRGRQGAGPNRLADLLIALFPDADWLYAVGASPLRLKLAGRTVARDDWKKLLDPAPHLFPSAGLAILREGKTPESQIMATLDYGRNLFHAALDRNQITLMAFGRVFTQGPGSLYNAGSGGIVRSRDAKLNRFIGHGSLAQNVMLVDGRDQMPCIGTLRHWAPDPGCQVVASEVPGIAPGVVHRRALALDHGLLVVVDRVQADKAHVFDFVYHNFGRLSLGRGWHASPAEQPLGKRDLYDCIEHLQRLTGAGPVRLSWDLTEQVHYSKLEKLRQEKKLTPMFLELHQVASPGAEAFIGDTALNNPNTGRVPEATPSLFRRVRGKSAWVVTVLEPRQGPSRIQRLDFSADHRLKVTRTDGSIRTLNLDEWFQMKK